MSELASVKAKLWLAETVFRNPYIPEHVRAKLFPQQAEFLAYMGFEALYGGAAGGGKSFALLMAALQFVDVPGYRALILRRNYTMLAKAGAIMDLSKEWLWPTKAKWKGDEYKWTFPSGATLEFGHMDTEAAKLQYQGAAFFYVGFDEATHFDGPMYSYLFSRVRRPKGTRAGRVPLRMRGGTNPGGIGHEYFRKRFIDPLTREPSVQFFPAKASDNTAMDVESYVQNLAHVEPLLRRQLLEGDWNAVEGGRFKKEWFRWWRFDGDYVMTDDGERFLIKERPVFMTCDPAASTSQMADSFVLSTWLLTPRGNLLWLECTRGKFEIGDQVKQVQAACRRYPPLFVGIEEVLNQKALAQLMRRSTDPAVPVRSLSPKGKDKLVRATGGIVLAETGRVLLPMPPIPFPMDDVMAELQQFTGSPDNHDDIVDTLSYAAEVLPGLGTGVRQAPNFYNPGQGFTAAAIKSADPPKPAAKSPTAGPRPFR